MTPTGITPEGMTGEWWEEDYNVNAFGLSVGQVSRWSPYEGLTDEQADSLHAELEAREARRLPLGFRQTMPGRRVCWPDVPRFDVL